MDYENTFESYEVIVEKFSADWRNELNSLWGFRIRTN